MSQHNETAELSKVNALLKEEIAERKRAEEALRRSEARLRAVFERAAIGIALLSKGGRLMESNSALQQMLGYSEQELRGMLFAELARREDVADVRSFFQKMMENESGHEQMETRYIRQSGQTAWVQLTVSLIRRPQGETHFAVCLVEDITEHKQAEENIRRRNKELAALNSITAAVSRSLELPEVLATLSALLAKHLDIPRGVIFLYDKAEDSLHMQTSWGLSEQMSSRFKQFSMNSFYERLLVYQNYIIFELNDVEDVPTSDDASSNGNDYLCVSLIAKGEFQGFALLDTKPLQVFRDNQFAFFKTLGQQVGVAIQNAKLFEQVRTAQERLQTLSHRLVEVQEAERRHIARELHDQVGQTLTGLMLSLELCKRLPHEAAKGYMGNAQKLANELIAQVRDLSLILRPPMLDDLGLLPALLWYFERYTALTDIRITFEHTGLERRFQPQVETAGYRIAQEALTNIARYAGVNEAIVHIWADQQLLCVQVKDNGAGFDYKATMAKSNSGGLTGMRERALLLGGRLNIESSPGGGVRLTAELPLGNPTEKVSGKGSDSDDDNSAG